MGYNNDPYISSTLQSSCFTKLKHKYLLTKCTHIKVYSLSLSKENQYNGIFVPINQFSDIYNFPCFTPSALKYYTFHGKYFLIKLFFWSKLSS